MEGGERRRLSARRLELCSKHHGRRWLPYLRRVAAGRSWRKIVTWSLTARSLVASRCGLDSPSTYLPLARVHVPHTRVSLLVSRCPPLSASPTLAVPDMGRQQVLLRTVPSHEWDPKFWSPEDSQWSLSGFRVVVDRLDTQKEGPVSLRAGKLFLC